MDGEGSLSLARRSPRWRSHEYSVRVVLYNSNRKVLEDIRKTFGGILTDVGARNRIWKPGHALIWTNDAAARLLTIVAPFLSVKSKQAEVLLRFVTHLRKCKRYRDSRGRLLPLRERETQIREAFHQRLKELNARGTASARVRDRGGGNGRPRGDAVLSPMYLAGFIDGEGSLMITRSKDARSGRPHYRARISLSNTDKAVLEKIRRSYTGILANQPARNPRWKDVYQLVWSGGMVWRLLSSVARHLRVKREQAAVLMAFVRHQKSTRQGRQGRNGRFFGPLSERVIAHRNGLCNRIRALNARGLVVISAGRGPSSPP